MEAQYIEINKHGTKFYCKDKAMTKCHRGDGPAVEYAGGTKEWYLNGKLHREDGAAVEWADGDKAWYINGKLHREDGAAIEYAGGTKEWYLNGKLHREDGAAIVRTYGYKAWYLEGKKYTQAEFKAKMQPTKELTVADIEKLLGHRVKIVKQ